MVVDPITGVVHTILNDRCIKVLSVDSLVYKHNDQAFVHFHYLEKHSDTADHYGLLIQSQSVKRSIVKDLNRWTRYQDSAI